MAEKLLEIKDLHAGVEGKEILKGLNLSINKGEVHVILGPNGSGKSTLMNIILGHPKYEVTGGTMSFEGADLNKLKTIERARKGIFLSFQTPEEIPGITVENMLRTAKQAVSDEHIKILAFRKKLKKHWMTAHRSLTVAMLLCLVLHIASMGITLPSFFTGSSDAATSATALA